MTHRSLSSSPTDETDLSGSPGSRSYRNPGGDERPREQESTDRLLGGVDEYESSVPVSAPTHLSTLASLARNASRHATATNEWIETLTVGPTPDGDT